jgi:RNA polymerase sigma factor (TIGR02999 family)
LSTNSRRNRAEKGTFIFALFAESWLESGCGKSWALVPEAEATQNSNLIFRIYRKVRAIPEESDVTQILREWSQGDAEAPSRLMPLVYEELRRRAADCLRRERKDHTLQPTALVHEAYVKLVGQDRAQWKNRAHFCSVAAQLMRRILVKYAEAHNADKRGGQMRKIYLDETRELAQERAPDLLALDDALKSLAVSHPRESEIVELKFFGGLNAKEIGEVLDVSTKTVLRDWQFAKAWLNRQLAREELYG